MKALNINELKIQAHTRSAALSQPPRRSRATWVAVIAAIGATLGTGCAGGNDFRQSGAAQDKSIPQFTELAAQPGRTERDNVNSFDDFESRRPIGPNTGATRTAEEQASHRRALKQFENFRNQQAQLAEAWNRALITAAWQQAIQQQLHSGQGGGYQGGQGQRRVLSTYDVTGTGVYEGVGVMTPSGSWYPGQ